jgi:Domain of unknown function DUF11
VVYKVKDQSSTVDGGSAEPFALAATDSLTPLTSPKPNITLSLDRHSARQGDPVTVTATLTNSSTDMPASAARVVLNLPAGVELVSNDSGTASNTWDPGTLSPGAAATYHWTVRGTQDGLARLTASAQDQAYGETFTAPETSATLDVDFTPPSSTIACAHASGADPNITVSWGATDASPIAGYDIGLSADGGPVSRWLSGTTQTSATYSGQAGHAYSFQVQAVDELGNRSGPVPCGPVAVGFVPVAPVSPTAPPSPPVPAPARLRISKLVMKDSRLTVSGVLARGATGVVSGTYRARGAHASRARARIVHGRCRLVFRLSSRMRKARRGVLRLSYPGDSSHAGQRLSRRVTPQR